MLLGLGFDREVDDRDVDVLLLREPGGEDVRVAMLRPYGQVTPATGITPCVSPGAARQGTRQLERSGRVKRNVLPTPALDSASMLPPCA